MPSDTTSALTALSAAEKATVLDELLTARPDLDYAIDRAGDVVHRCAKLGIDLPHEELPDLMPEWDGLTD